MEKMNKVAVTLGTGPNFEVREMPYPKLLKGGAILRNSFTGICGTDKHTYNGQTKQFAGTAFEFDMPFPLVQGHESSGVIEEIDEEGSKTLDFYGEPLKVGDRVTWSPVIVCGKCFWCRHAASFTWCEGKERGIYGQNQGVIDSNHMPDEVYGGFSRYMNIKPGSYLYKMPDELTDEQGAMVEMMTVTYALDKVIETNSLQMDGLQFGGTVVIQGVGPIGMAFLIKARMLGAYQIIATDVSDYRLSLAKEFGADYTLNVKKTTEKDRIDFIKGKTRGFGADVVIECTGVPTVVAEGLEYLRKAGTYLCSGMFAEVGDSSIDMHKVLSKSLHIRGMSELAVIGWRPSMDMMVKHKKDFPWAKYFSHKYPIDKIIEAFKKSMTDDSMKVLIDPWA